MARSDALGHRGIEVLSLLRRLAPLIWVWLCWTNTASAQDYPTLGQLTYEDGEGSISFDCGLQGANLHCNFTQLRVSHSPVLPADDIEKAIPDMVAAGATVCGDDFFESLRKTREGEPIAGIRNEDQRADLLQLYSVYETFCQNPTEQTARAIYEESNARAAATCKIGTYPFVLDFAWNVTTARWETVSQPNGPCGIVTAAFMEIDKDPNTVAYGFWTYGQQTLATNQGGEDALVGSCKDRPNEEMSYTWRSSTTLMQCKYVAFSLF